MLIALFCVGHETLRPIPEAVVSPGFGRGRALR
jgi:hypothetical protein